MNDSKTPTRREAKEGNIVSSIIDFTLLSEQVEVISHEVI